MNLKIVLGVRIGAHFTLLGLEAVLRAATIDLFFNGN